MSTPSVTTSPTKPFTADAIHTRLAAMAGSFRGPTQTWFDPAKPADESATEARVDLLLAGRFVRLTYASTAMGAPHAGEMTVGHEDDRFTIAWIDSFHTGTAITTLVGDKGAEDISCVGSYAAGAERWWWRIALRLDGDTLVVEEHNIAPSAADPTRPGAQEDRAIEMRLQRA